jgi:hypothetical protein
LQYDDKRGLGDGSEVLEQSRSVFLKDEVDFWIDVDGELKEVVEGMGKTREGLVLSVVEDVEREEEVVSLKTLVELLLLGAKRQSRLKQWGKQPSNSRIKEFDAMCSYREV